MNETIPSLETAAHAILEWINAPGQAELRQVMGDNGPFAQLQAALKEAEKPRVRHCLAQFPLDEGDVRLQWPEPLSPESAQELRVWMELMLQRRILGRVKAVEPEHQVKKPKKRRKLKGRRVSQEEILAVLAKENRPLTADQIGISIGPDVLKNSLWMQLYALRRKSSIQSEQRDGDDYWFLPSEKADKGANPKPPPRTQGNETAAAGNDLSVVLEVLEDNYPDPLSTEEVLSRVEMQSDDAKIELQRLLSEQTITRDYGDSGSLWRAKQAG